MDTKTREVVLDRAPFANGELQVVKRTYTFDDGTKSVSFMVRFRGPMDGYGGRTQQFNYTTKDRDTAASFYHMLVEAGKQSEIFCFFKYK